MDKRSRTRLLKQEFERIAGRAHDFVIVSDQVEPDNYVKCTGGGHFEVAAHVKGYILTSAAQHHLKPDQVAAICALGFDPAPNFSYHRFVDLHQPRKLADLTEDLFRILESSVDFNPEIDSSLDQRHDPIANTDRREGDKLIRQWNRLQRKGDGYFEMRDYEAADQCYQRIGYLKMGRIVMNSSHSNTECLNHIDYGEKFYQVSQYEIALGYYHQALLFNAQEIVNNNISNYDDRVRDHFDMSGPIYHKIGSVYRHIGQSSASIRYYAKAIEAYEGCSTMPQFASGADIVDILESLGQEYERLGLKDEAIRTYQRGVGLARLLNGDGRSDHWQDRDEIVKMLARKGLYDDVAQVIQTYKAHPSYERFKWDFQEPPNIKALFHFALLCDPPIAPSQVVTDIVGKAEVMIWHSEFDEARNLLAIAMANAEQLGDASAMAPALGMLGFWYEKQGDLESAMAHYDKAAQAGNAHIFSLQRYLKNLERLGQVSKGLEVIQLIASRVTDDANFTAELRRRQERMRRKLAKNTWPAAR